MADLTFHTDARFAVSDVHLSVVENVGTGLFHGAIYRQHPKPTGHERHIMEATYDAGFVSLREATMAINAAFPAVYPLNLPENDDDVSCIFLPVGALITLLTPNLTKANDDRPVIIEVRRSYDFHAPVLDIILTRDQLIRLEQLNKIVPVGSSGDDPDLYYRYDDYIVSATH